MNAPFWQEVEELNRTPLSQACRALLQKPNPSSLYLLQALSATLEEWENSASKSMKYLVGELFPIKSPKLVYRLLTTSAELSDEMSDSVMLRNLEQEDDAEDKLLSLLDDAECNLEDNEFNLSGMETVSE